MLLLKKILSCTIHNETHILLNLCGIKIRFLRPSFAKLKKQSPYYYYKQNNVDITTLPPAEGQLRDIQLANLVLLKELDHVCKQANLTYWLDGGTLLGAIRHKGFIPWDDDIDTAMLRKDYEQIVEAFEKYSRDPDIFVTYRALPDKPLDYFLKVQHRKCPHLFVDIFPWDNYGKRLTTEEQLSQTLEIKKIRKNETSSIPQQTAPGDMLINKRKEIMARLTSSEDEKGDYVWGVDFSHPWKNWFTHYEVLHPMKTIEFEGFEFPCLNDPDAFLSRLYGNYMSYPNKITMGHSMFLNLSNEEKEVIKNLAASLNIRENK